MSVEIFKSMRTVVNKGHSAIFNDDAFNDMPNPPFKEEPDEDPGNSDSDYAKGGQSFVISHNDSREYTRDLNYKRGTGGTDKWRFEYLNGESEYGEGGAPKFGRGNGWNFDNSDNGSTDESALKTGNGCATYFMNREDSKTLIYQRTKSSLSKVWYTAVMDNVNWGNDVTFDAARRQKANYVPAKGITFRYKERAKETYGALSFDNVWKVRPMNFLSLLYSTGVDNSPVYLAEIIAFSKTEAEASGCQTHKPYSLGNRRRQTGQLHYSTDWYYIKEDEQGNKVQTKGGAPWNPMGQYKHNENDAVLNDFPEWHNGTVTATLSEKSVKKIMDLGLMCVGVIFGGQCFQNCSYNVNSTMSFEIYDTKLLVPEFYGDNNIDIVNYSDVESPLLTRILEEPACCEDAHKNYMAARQSGHLQELYRDK